MQLPEWNPPQRPLLGPGRANVDARILRAMAAPVVGHLDRGAGVAAAVAAAGEVAGKAADDTAANTTDETAGET